MNAQDRPIATARDAAPEALGASSAPMAVLFLACSSFSGSTLLSFLLNTHPDMTTVGHTIGWRYRPGEVFHCSCGATLETCPFWAEVATRFAAAGLPFSYHDFGTRYRLVDNDRLNRYLTAQVLRFRGARIEALRDAAVRCVPAWARKLARQDRANATLVRAALDYARARVYVDNTHSPYRAYSLSRIAEFDLSVAYLVRDIRDTVFSHMKNHGWDARDATRIWLDEQESILRIGRGFDRFHIVAYEDLCERTEDTLAGIHRFMGVPAIPFTSDFGAAEHHILGNAMRFGQKKIARDLRWRSELSRRDRSYVEAAAQGYVARHPGHPLSAILSRQLGDS